MAASTLIPKEIKPNERRKLRELILEVELSEQIQGETIPSIIDDDINCQVIIFLNVKINNINSVHFVASILQEKIKSFCVIRFYDQINEVYSFAHKRLSKIDSGEIVIDNMFETKPIPIALNSEQKRLMNKYVSYGVIWNTKTKYEFYLELSIKTYIIFNIKLYSKTRDLLESEIWMNEDEMMDVYNSILLIEKLKSEQLKTDLSIDKVRINSELKKIMEHLNEKLED